MKYKIVYDGKGRIRFRCGQYAFMEHEESKIEKALTDMEFVKSAKVSCANGGILVMYEGIHREDVIKAVEMLDVKQLWDIKEDESLSVRAIDRKFRKDIKRIVVKRLVHKLLIPKPLSTAITVFKGCKYIIKGIQELFSFRLDVEVLDAASITACLAQRDFKTAGSVMFLLSVSALLEDYTKAKTKAALTDSLMIHTDKLWKVDDSGEYQVSMSELNIGDRIRVQTGSVIAVDGEIIDGQAEINEASMTGEALPVSKAKGSTVFAGTVIENGNIVIKIRALSENTRISQIAELISRSDSLKAQMQGKAERLADSIVPYSFLAFLTAWLLTRDIKRAVSLLMVDYSCAIKLSVPIAVISAIKEAADHDMTVKGGKYLEAYANADTIVFDKTGTLTNAEPKLKAVVPFGRYTSNEVLKIAACIEEHFPHSVARAIVNAAKEKGIVHAEEHTEVIYIVAHGIATKLFGERAVIGSRHFIAEDEGISISEEQQKIIDDTAQGSSVVYLAIGGQLAGALCINDPPRKEAAKVIADLKNADFKHIVMLTGDSKGAAESTAKMLGIDEYYYQVLPENKHGYISKLKSQGKSVVMVGDGINDSPALAEANVSVAMSDASDIARETADITLRSCDLEELIHLRTLSRLLMKRIENNYRFILGFNSALMALGFFGIVTPGFSALLHNTSTMLICLKSMTPLLHDSEIISEENSYDKNDIKN